MSKLSFSGALTIVFIVLKLCKVVKWSWVWILAPSWITFLIAFLFIMFTLISNEFKK